MHAIVRVAGVQARVEPGDTIRLPKLNVDAGTSTTFDEVLLLSDGEKVTVGTPTVEGAQVTAEVLKHDRGEKLIVFKKKLRKRYRRTNGHRQDYTEVKITVIVTA
ncbi:MAG TPA: 50S ribosomal protein L21 [Firmicutes bacterium]|nr:50S ribosomal protein L21 [Bacillota bacterium]